MRSTWWDEDSQAYRARPTRSRSLVSGLLLMAACILAAVLLLAVARPAHAQSTVHAGVDPIGWLTQPFTFSGWALDKASLSGTGVDVVHVWAYPNSVAPPVFLGEAVYGHTRPDVAMHHGSAWSNVGWTKVVEGLPAGQYQLAAFFRSTVTGLWWSMPHTITIGTTLGVWIESPTAGQPLLAHVPFTVKGGAVDFGPGHPGTPGTFPSLSSVLIRRAGSSSPLFVGTPDVTYRQVTFGGARPEIAAALNLSFTNIGWEVQMPGLPPGDYDVIFMGTTNPNSTGIEHKFENETVVVRIPVVAP